jgi:hypothetical protein
MHDGSRTRTKLAKSCKILQDPPRLGFIRSIVFKMMISRARKPGVA